LHAVHRQGANGVDGQLLDVNRLFRHRSSSGVLVSMMGPDGEAGGAAVRLVPDGCAAEVAECTLRGRPESIVGAATHDPAGPPRPRRSLSLDYSRGVKRVCGNGQFRCESGLARGGVQQPLFPP
jgi:hypothetical protein